MIAKNVRIDIRMIKIVIRIVKLVVLRIGRMVMSIVRMVKGVDQNSYENLKYGLYQILISYIHMIKTQYPKVQNSLRIRMISPTWNALRSC